MGNPKVQEQVFVGIVHVDEFKDNPNLYLTFPPLVTVDRFAMMTGLTAHAVNGQIQIGNIPTLKQGKRRMVNLAKIYEECLKAER